MTGHKKCKELCDKLSDYLDGDLGQKECVLIEEHLRECPPCSLIYESLRTAVSVCEKGISDDIPEDVHERLRQFLRERCQKGVI